MLEFQTGAVTQTPFPHVIVDNYLHPDCYRAICASFPVCPANSGPTGFSVFQDDEAFAALLADQPAWRSLFDQVQSQAFVNHVLAQFPEIFAQQASVDLSAARFAAHVETRAEKELCRLPPTGLAPDELWVRFDILQGNTGYTRMPHLDHRRRLVSMLIYCCDADENAMTGGDLVLHGDAGEDAVVRARHNRMVLFPCHQRSLHSVSKILSQNAPRNFIQITVSSSVDLWRAPAHGLGEVLRSNVSAMARHAKRLIGANRAAA